MLSTFAEQAIINGRYLRVSPQINNNLASDEYAAILNECGQTRGKISVEIGELDELSHAVGSDGKRKRSSLLDGRKRRMLFLL